MYDSCQITDCLKYFHHFPAHLTLHFIRFVFVTFPEWIHFCFFFFYISQWLNHLINTRNTLPIYRKIVIVFHHVSTLNWVMFYSWMSLIHGWNFFNHFTMLNDPLLFGLYTFDCLNPNPQFLFAFKRIFFFLTTFIAVKFSDKEMCGLQRRSSNEHWRVDSKIVSISLFVGNK